MVFETQHSINDFWLIGINYRKADVSTRGDFAVNNEQYIDLLENAPVFGVTNCFVLSTCNRTEIYGMCCNPEQLIQLLCSITKGSNEEFEKQHYEKNSNDAILHLYNVAAGLDSQILGDYEIVSQLKNSFKLAQEYQRTNLFTERLYQSVLQSARDIRSKTDLSGGTVSVAYAAVQYIAHTSKDISQEQILIIGSGKMGMASCKNLIQMSYANNIAICNRTDDKAKEIADTLNIHFRSYSDLQESINHATIVIVATNASTPILDKRHFSKEDKKLLIDLSIPNNIDPMLGEYKGIHLINVDELSKINDATLQKRMAEVPKAKAIINFNIHQFAEWYLMQKNVPMLKAVKEKLSELNQELNLICKCDQKDVQKALNSMAKKMKSGDHQPGCTYLETISSFVATAVK